jgi:hypothetical protein
LPRMIASTESRSESESSITIRGERVLQQTASACAYEFVPLSGAQRAAAQIPKHLDGGKHR